MLCELYRKLLYRTLAFEIKLALVCPVLDLAGSAYDHVVLDEADID